MTEDLPSFDPDHETPPAPAIKPPKKPRWKPAKKRAKRDPGTPASVTKTRRAPTRGKVKRIVKKRRKRYHKAPGHPAYRTGADRVKNGGKVDRRTKAYRQAQETHSIEKVSAELRIDMVKFLETIGIFATPWQSKIINALTEKKT